MQHIEQAVVLLAGVLAEQCPDPDIPKQRLAVLANYFEDQPELQGLLRRMAEAIESFAEPPGN